MTKLRECPFCGGVRPRVRSDHGYFAVECTDCRSVSAWINDEELAVGNWQRRSCGEHFGYVVDGEDYYFADFPREEWCKHRSVVAVFSDGVNLADPIPYTVTEAGRKAVGGGS